MRALEVLEPGPATTVQDLGRPGLARLGVGPSGAADIASLRLANRLVGNAEAAAGLEVPLGGLHVRASAPLFVAVTGAVGPVRVGERDAACNAVVALDAGEVLRLGPARAGLRTYLAVRGGIVVAPVLGSRSTDVLAGLGPPQLRAGDVLPVGEPPAEVPLVDLAPVAAPPGGDLQLGVLLGPRDDWSTPAAVRTFLSEPYVVTPDSNRVGMRLEGPPLERGRGGELPSEGVVSGAVQVPAGGSPVVFLADHPLTGGYPVVAVVVSADLPLAGQARPGQRLRFRALPRKELP